MQIPRMTSPIISKPQFGMSARWASHLDVPKPSEELVELSDKRKMIVDDLSPNCSMVPDATRLRKLKADLKKAEDAPEKQTKRAWRWIPGARPNAQPVNVSKAELVADATNRLNIFARELIQAADKRDKK